MLADAPWYTASHSRHDAQSLYEVQISRLSNRICSPFGRRNSSQRNTLLQSYKPGLAEAEERLELLMQKPLQQLR